MKKDFLKKLRDSLPEPVMKRFGWIIRNKLIKNELYIDTYQKLIDRGNLDEKTIKQIQFGKLKEILIYASQYVPYYNELFKEVNFNPIEFSKIEQMETIPFLTKTIIRKNFDKLISAKKNKNGYYIATTGGSTGEPLKVQLDYDSIFMENAFINYYRRKLGYNVSDRLATFRGIEFGDLLYKYNPMYNEVLLSPFKLNEESLVNFIDIINSYHPVYLNGYLSTIYFFAHLLKQTNKSIDVKLKGIFLISENIDPIKRSFIEDFFKVKSLTFYGHSERAIIAEEIKDGIYRFDPLYGYTETIDGGGDEYEIAGTGFLNYSMPLIRYKTDDVCVKSEQNFKITGRRSAKDILFGSNGARFGHAAFNFHSEIFNNVIQYQLVQKQKGKAELLIVVNKDFRHEEVIKMKKEIDKKTKGVLELSIRIVDRMILTNRGKFNQIINSSAQETTN